MKPILDLTRAISNADYFLNQFTKWGDDKNILFVNPQLSGKCLYKMILPFFSMFNEKIATAISGLSRYDYEGQIYGSDEIFIADEMIEWSDFIVFPFTTQPLVSEFYAKIREVKEDVKIVFLVDFNFYELSSLHPYKKVFDEPMALSATEDNIWFADICLTSNAVLAQVLIEKFTALGQSKYVETPSYLSIACMPYMIDTDIVLKNVEFDPMKPVLVNPNEHINETKKHIEEIAKAAEVVKEADIAEKQKKQHEAELHKEEINIEQQQETILNNEIETSKTDGDSKKENQDGNSKQQSEPSSRKTSKSKSDGKSKSKPSNHSSISKPKQSAKRGKSTKKRR